MFIVATRAQARLIRRALRQQDGYPARGVTVGPVQWEPPEACEVDASGDPLPTPGFTTESVSVDSESGDTVAIELPKSLEKFAGKTLRGVTLPALTAEADLPAAIKLVRATRLADALPKTTVR